MTFLRRFSEFLLQRRWHAVGVAFGLAFVPYISTISILIAALVTLRKNAYEGALVFIAASVPLAIRYLIAPADIQAAFILGMVEVALVSNLIVWVFAILLRQYGSWSFLLEVILFAGIIMVGLTHFFAPNIQGWWTKQLDSYFVKTMDTVDVADKEEAKEKQAILVDAFKYYATGFAVVSVFINILLQLVVARWWQAVLFNPGGLKQELQRIRLNYVAGGVFLMMLVLGYFKNNLVLDSIPIAYAVFMLAGLSIIHYLVGVLTKTKWLWLTFVYLGIILSPLLGIVTVAIVAFFDTCLDFRKRIPKQVKF